MKIKYFFWIIVITCIFFNIANAFVYSQEVEKEIKKEQPVAEAEVKEEVVKLGVVCALCKEEVTGNFCSNCGIRKGSVLSSDPNASLRNEIKMKRAQLANLMGFYSRERNELIAEKKLLDLQIKEMENKINIHNLKLKPHTPNAIFNGYALDGSEIWFTPSGASR